MSDRDWQHAVLRELGAAERGLADSRPPGPVPRPAPAPSAAGRATGSGPSAWYPEGSVGGEGTAGAPVETAPSVLSAPPPPGREATAVFGLPARENRRSDPAEQPNAARGGPSEEPSAGGLPAPPSVPPALQPDGASSPAGPAAPASPTPSVPAHGGFPEPPAPPSVPPALQSSGGAAEQPNAAQPAHGDRPASVFPTPPPPPPIPPALQPAAGEASGPANAARPAAGAPSPAGPAEQPNTEQPNIGQPNTAPPAHGDRPAAGSPAEPPTTSDAPQPAEAAAAGTAEPSASPYALVPAAPPPAVVVPTGDAPGVPPASTPQQPPAEPQEQHQQQSQPQQPQPAVPAVPEQQPVGPQLAAEALVRRQVHGDSALKRVGRGMRRVVGASAAGDARLQEDMAQRLRSPVPSCRRIAVTSIRGGAGKTTVAALLASTIAEYREDRVLAMDADSGLGSLPLRLGVQPQYSMGQLAAARPRTWEETARFLAPAEHGLWVMSGSARGQVTELELETFQTAASGVGRYFSAAVIDCGAGIVARLQRGVLAAAHAQVFVTPGTVDGAISARQTLSWFVGSGYEDLLRRTVVVLVTHSPHAGGDADLERAQQVLSDGGMPVEVVPYDRHLATGTAISLDRVSGAARAAAGRIATEVFVRSLSGGAL